MQWPIEFEEKMYATSFGKTYARICGPINGEPILLMHGTGDNSTSWAPNIEALSKDYRVYAVDRINGYNMSIGTKPINNIDEIIQWMNELYDSIGFQTNIYIIGMSLGAHLAARYALAYPARVKKAVLLAPPHIGVPANPKFVLGLLSTLLPFKCFLKNFMYWMFDDLITIKGDYGKQVADIFIENGELAVKCFTLHKFVNPKMFTKEELLNLTVPAYFLVGENDINYSAKKAFEFVKKEAPHIKSELFTNAGHDLPISLASEVNGKILQFLKA